MQFWPIFQLRFNNNVKIVFLLVFCSVHPFATAFTELQACKFCFLRLVKFWHWIKVIFHAYVEAVFNVSTDLLAVSLATAILTAVSSVRLSTTVMSC